MKKALLILLIATPFLFWYCKTSEVAISNKDVSFVYNPVSAILHPEYKIYHNSDTSSLLYFKFRTYEILFKANEETGRNQGHIRIFYKIFPSIESSEILDSATTDIKINKSQNAYLISYIPLRLDHKNKYFIEIVTTDKNRNAVQQEVIEIDKENISSSQFFLFTNIDNQQPNFHNSIHDTTNLKIGSQYNTSKNIIIDYYTTHFDPALPPFTAKFEDFKIPYVKETYNLENNNDLKFTINKKGVYTFNIKGIDSIRTVFNYFDDHYPEIKTADKLLEPIIYLTSSKEFKTLAKYKDPKIAVDSFWLNTTGNVERAKELIRIYYNRAQLANYYFTSFKEGWKTDRGMIYLVLGMPTTIFKSKNSETWTYGKSNNYKAMEFTFNKKYHPFSNDNYVLDRSEIYDRLWYQAVDTWRNGRAFSVMN